MSQLDFSILFVVCILNFECSFRIAYHKCHQKVKWIYGFERNLLLRCAFAYHLDFIFLLKGKSDTLISSLTESPVICLLFLSQQSLLHTIPFHFSQYNAIKKYITVIWLIWLYLIMNEMEWQHTISAVKDFIRHKKK